MVKTLLERFGISVPQGFDDCNLIGVDFGDGEFCAALAVWSNVEKRMELHDLMLNESGTLRKNPNAYWISPKEQRFVYDTAESELTRKEGVRYYNFKRCPGTPESQSQFVRDDGSTAPLNYEQVMARGFNIAIRTLYRCNPLLINRSKPTIILVGRPSSSGWAASEKAYARLLEQGLELSDLTDQPVRVAVEAESWAALAQETDPLLGNGIKRGQVVVVLDNGSSTFDITVICRVSLNQVGSGEDSFQFGGNLLDRILLKMLHEKAEREHPGMPLLSVHGHKLGIRIAKEFYYGLDGRLQSPALYLATLDGPPDHRGRPPRLEFRIDDEVIDQALGTVPVTAMHYEEGLGAMIQKRPFRCDSWLDGCRTVYRQFYNKMQPLFTRSGDENHPKIPDHVILSGGVSVMPEVQKVVEEVFGVKPVLTTLPNYSVSHGLAYVLGSEVQKGQYLKELMERLEELLPDGGSLRESIVDAGADAYWETARRAMEDWAQADGSPSIRDWYDHFYLPIFNHDLNLPVREGAKRWYQNNGLECKISDMLQAKFRDMFGEYADIFQYKLPDVNFSALAGSKVTIWTDFSFMFAQLTADEDAHSLLSDASMRTPRAPQWRQTAYQRFLAMEQSIRSGGTNTAYYDRPGVLKVFGRAHTDLKYQGLKAMFREGISTETANGIRTQIVQLLKEQMKEYVELITPYFNITAKKQ